jgi:hypothetical protein
MTNYKFTFTTSTEVIVIVKAFSTYKDAENFKTAYFAKHSNIFHSAMETA